MSTLGVGLLGWSSIARRRFLPALLASDRAHLAGLGTRDPQAAAATAPPTRIGTYEDLLADPQVELVYISLPNHLHEAWSVRALNAGKHVLCEKPLAPTMAAVQRMQAAARASGRRLGEAVMFRHHPQHAIVRELVADGRLGPLRHLHAAFGFHLDRPGDFRLDPQCAGGAANDLLTYVVGAAGLLLPSPLVACRGYARWRDGVDIAAAGTGHTRTGEQFSFHIGFDQAYTCAYELVGERGRLRLERAFSVPPDYAGTLRLETAAGRKSIPLPAADQFRLMLDHFCDQIRNRADAGPDDACLCLAHQQIELVRAGLERVEVRA